MLIVCTFRSNITHSFKPKSILAEISAHYSLVHFGPKQLGFKTALIRIMLCRSGRILSSAPVGTASATAGQLSSPAGTASATAGQLSAPAGTSAVPKALSMDCPLPTEGMYTLFDARWNSDVCDKELLAFYTACIIIYT